MMMDDKFFFKQNIPNGRYVLYSRKILIGEAMAVGKVTLLCSRYTGEEEAGSMGASFDIPIPIPSFGFRWSY
jgi:hypothetical protein